MGTVYAEQAPPTQIGFQKPQLSQELGHRAAPLPDPTGNSSGVQKVGQKACPGKGKRGHANATWGSLSLLMSGSEVKVKLA